LADEEFVWSRECADGWRTGDGSSSWFKSWLGCGLGIPAGSSPSLAE